MAAVSHGEGRSPIDPWDDPAVHAEQLKRAETILRAAGVEANLHQQGVGGTDPHPVWRYLRLAEVTKQPPR